MNMKHALMVFAGTLISLAVITRVEPLAKVAGLR